MNFSVFSLASTNCLEAVLTLGPLLPAGPPEAVSPHLVLVPGRGQGRHVQGGHTSQGRGRGSSLF